MKQLTNIENIIFLLGAVLMVVGSGANIFVQVWAPYVFAMGAVCFALMQMKQVYEGTNITIKRLRRIMVASDVFFLLAAVMMFANQNNLFNIDILLYVKYVHNNWVVMLLVASVLQLYSSHRISHELAKEAKKN